MGLHLQYCNPVTKDRHTSTASQGLGEHQQELLGPASTTAGTSQVCSRKRLMFSVEQTHHFIVSFIRFGHLTYQIQHISDNYLNPAEASAQAEVTPAFSATSCVQIFLLCH